MPLWLKQAVPKGMPCHQHNLKGGGGLDCYLKTVECR